MNKICTYCFEYKIFDEFTKDKRNKSGISSCCQINKIFDLFVNDNNLCKCLIEINLFKLFTIFFHNCKIARYISNSKSG